MNEATQALHRAVVEARLTNIGEANLYVNENGRVSADKEFEGSQNMRVEFTSRGMTITGVEVEIGGEFASVERVQVGGTNISAITGMVKVLVGIAYSELNDGESLEWD